MTAFLQQYISPALPVILWLFRGVTAGLAVWLLVRCCKSLFRGRDRESWGFVTLSNGARYELYHWENVIGRARPGGYPGEFSLRVPDTRHFAAGRRRDMAGRPHQPQQRGAAERKADAGACQSEPRGLHRPGRGGAVLLPVGAAPAHRAA